MYEIYGIKNCNTMKKAFDYLNAHKIPYEFHDYKKLGISAEKLKEWASQVGWEKLLNKQGTTWRSLDEETKNAITNEKKAVALMQEKTSVIKRPVIELGNEIVIIGFEENLYNAIHWKH
ncbi:arsenate reductase [Arachidicoccus ginsenosidimutans]|uniref:ArsC family reductase n=1 Tax=Arachidicoccus sp. BS20 TaxID=1850526 RepID=UPI0007F141D6|nr:ArsC family reductase [Arachidicoccus sp. BS20]ANI88395.1 arsenate reductase [Arachidicoccus sp. BS20]